MYEHDNLIYHAATGRSWKSHKYIKKIGNKYIYKEDLEKAKRTLAKKGKSIAKTTNKKVKKALNTVKDTKIKRIGNKVYAGNKKTLKKIEKSGAGGNKYYETKTSKKEIKKAKKEGTLIPSGTLNPVTNNKKQQKKYNKKNEIKTFSKAVKTKDKIENKIYDQFDESTGKPKIISSTEKKINKVKKTTTKKAEAYSKTAKKKVNEVLNKPKEVKKTIKDVKNTAGKIKNATTLTPYKKKQIRKTVNDPDNPGFTEKQLELLKKAQNLSNMDSVGYEKTRRKPKNKK